MQCDGLRIKGNQGLRGKEGDGSWIKQGKLAGTIPQEPGKVTLKQKLSYFPFPNFINESKGKALPLSINSVSLSSVLLQQGDKIQVSLFTSGGKTLQLYSCTTEGDLLGANIHQR